VPKGVAPLFSAHNTPLDYLVFAGLPKTNQDGRMAAEPRRAIVCMLK